MQRITNLIWEGANSNGIITEALLADALLCTGFFKMVRGLGRKGSKEGRKKGRKEGKKGGKKEKKKKRKEKIVWCFFFAAMC